MSVKISYPYKHAKSNNKIGYMQFETHSQIALRRLLTGTHCKA